MLLAEERLELFDDPESTYSIDPRQERKLRRIIDMLKAMLDAHPNKRNTN